MFVRTEGITWMWEWHWIGTAVILLATFIYFRGLHKTKNRTKVQNGVFLVGVILLLIVATSPISNLATQLFSMRVLQRIMLVALIPLLIIGSDPMPAIFAGLPENIQKKLQKLPATRPTLFLAVHRAFAPAAIWLVFVCVFWLGYDLSFHQLTLQSRQIHGAEMGLLFIISSLYWWHILAVSPKLHDPMPPLVRIGYVLVGALPIKIVGLVLLFTNSTIYNYPGSLQLGHLSINDQSLGALFHWSLGGLVFTWTGFYLLRAWFGNEAKKPIMSHAVWSTHEKMRAPGFGNRIKPSQEKRLPKQIRSNKVPFKPEEENQECQNTRISSRFTAVPVRIFLIIKSRVVGSHEN